MSFTVALRCRSQFSSFVVEIVILGVSVLTGRANSLFDLVLGRNWLGVSVFVLLCSLHSDLVLKRLEYHVLARSFVYQWVWQVIFKFGVVAGVDRFIVVFVWLYVHFKVVDQSKVLVWLFQELILVVLLLHLSELLELHHLAGANVLNRLLLLRNLGLWLLVLSAQLALFEVFFCLENFVIVHVDLVNLTDTVVSIRVVSYHWLKLTGVNTVVLTDYSNQLVLRLVFRNRHVARWMVLFVTHQYVRD